MLTVGTRLGPFEITGSLGAGGMGEVYRARDTRLNRDVAIKVLPDLFAADPERLERFEREALVLASLNHPNIAHVYGVENRALVMELVAGEDLSQRLARGAMPMDEVFPVAKQIADALEAAHEQGIVHRDLKPANIKVRPDGTVKVLDFGLAKAVDTAVTSADAMQSPTLTARGTRVGVIIGTAAYMAPEQARGRAVDRRADIWAFGVVLHEMLTGQRAFEGDDISTTLANVLKEDARGDALPKDLPAPIRTLLRRCLEKDPRKRLRDIGEARLILDDPAALNPAWALSESTIALARPPVALWQRAAPWAVAAAGVGAAIVSIALWAPWRAPSAHAPRKLLAGIGADASMTAPFGASAILSPDGTTLVFVAQSTGRPRQLFVRKLDQLQASPLAGTDNAFIPFFSPNGQWIAFFADRKLKKISVTGGAAIPVCDSDTGRGGTWTDDDTIIFTPTGAPSTTLLRVPASGGTPAVFGALGAGMSTQRWPQALPGGKAVLYTEHSAGREFDGANLAVAPLAGGAPKVVARGAYYGRYVPGHLLYMQQGTLFAVPFDLDRLETSGQAVPALQGVSANPDFGSAQFAFAADGTLVFVPGAAGASTKPIDWLTRDGKASTLRATQATWSNPRFSPDGRKLAIDIYDGKQRDIWVYEWAHGRLTQLTFAAAEDRYAVWSPDGKRIAFGSDRARPGRLNLYWVNADGAGEPTRLTDSPYNQQPTSWHPTGRFLAFHENRAGATTVDLMVLPMEGDAARGWTPGTPTVFLATPAIEANSVFSPDGRWLAYQSNESGNPDIYVRSFPGPGGKWRVSTDGGSWPAWSPSSPEILFTNPNQEKVMVAKYAAAGDFFKADTAQLWSPTGYQSLSGALSGSYAVHPDGKRLAVSAADQTTAVALDKVVFITNFFDYLDKIAPVKK